MIGTKQSNSKTPTCPKESFESELRKGRESESDGRISNMLRKVFRGGSSETVGPEGFKKGSTKTYGGTCRGALVGIVADITEGVAEGGTASDTVECVVGTVADITEGGAVGIVARAVERIVERAGGCTILGAPEDVLEAVSEGRIDEGAFTVGIVGEGADGIVASGFKEVYG